MFNNINLKSLSNFKSSPKWTISSKTGKFEQINSNPGPGHYEFKLLQLSGQNISFTKEKRFFNEIIENLGPGSYNPINHSNGPKWSMAQRINIKDKEKHYPFYYNLNLNHLYTTPSFTFGKSKHKYNLVNNNTPGPGEYKPKIIDKSSKFSFGVKLKELAKPENTPGPGSYNIKNIEGIKYTMRIKKDQIEMKSETPGPGTYTNISYFPSGAKYTMSKKYPKQIDKKLNTPGPGAYNLNFKIKKNSPFFSFGKKNSYKNQLQTCKQDFYEIPSHLGEAPKWSFGLAQTNFKKTVENFPGPGSYNTLKFMDKQIKFSFTHAKKFQEKNRTTNDIGPGSYELNKLSPSPLWKFTTEIRFNQKDLDNSTPGPGFYNQNINFHGPKWSMVGKWKQLNDKSTIQSQGIMVSTFS